MAARTSCGGNGGWDPDYPVLPLALCLVGSAVRTCDEVTRCFSRHEDGDPDACGTTYVGISRWRDLVRRKDRSDPLGGRLGAYRAADGSDELRAALVRNLWRGKEPPAAGLAHVMARVAAQRAALAATPVDTLVVAERLPE